MKNLLQALPTLINTVALARCRHAPESRKVFQHFTSICVFSGPRELAAVLFLLLIASALATTHYVDVNCTNATPPYTNWTTAATNIQDAVDAAVAGDDVVVTNGTYGALSVNKPLSLRSFNGPSSTVIVGDAENGIRCASLVDGANLSGFTLEGGGTYGNGGGLLCQSQAVVVSNCVVSGNSALYAGGGAYGGTLNNCTLSSNSSGEILGFVPPSDSGSGGGAAFCALNNCTLTGNSAWNDVGAVGGGAYSCTLNNCTLTANTVRPVDPVLAFCISYSGSVGGGGAADCILNNCTLCGNSVSGFFFQGWVSCNGGAHNFISINIQADGDGAFGSTLNYCTLYHNSTASSIANHCLTADPLFVDTNGWANLRLQSNSPCINAGNNAYAPAGPDLDGNSRIVGGTVDIGAYEFQAPVSKISYAWLQQYGLPINSSIDIGDPDGDAVDNYHEWLAGTDPTNALSSPAQLTITPSGSGIILSWSTNAVGFTLQSTTNLLSPAAWVTSPSAPVVIAGQNTVTNPITGVRKFYRLVQRSGS